MVYTLTAPAWGRNSVVLKTINERVNYVGKPEFEWALNRKIGDVLKKLAEQKINWLVSTR